MKKITMGILAHVDAGKTTLSESLLFHGGAIRKMGRVDSKDAFLDTYDVEKNRGITVFSKQAIIEKDDTRLTIVDTPGHTDFSAEMERSLLAMDYALLIVSGADGVEAHTETVWQLLSDYDIPVFIFVNKMDIAHSDISEIINEMNKTLGSGIVDFSISKEELYEEIAVYDEAVMDYYFENGYIPNEMIQDLIEARVIFPVFNGSALKDKGVQELLNNILVYIKETPKNDKFGAVCYKIARDTDGQRLSFLKVTGGAINVKDVLCFNEKINQIRLYSGKKYELLDTATQGDVIAVTGPSKTYAGQGIGFEKDFNDAVLVPVLSYGVIVPDGDTVETFLPKLRELEEEDPTLHVVVDDNKKISIEVMGEIQLEILTNQCMERFGKSIAFDEGSILYKETLAEESYGVGHFEPLRHYAEVHLRLEPLPAGSGIIIDTDFLPNTLDKNWQNLIVSILKSREYTGVLTDSPITDLHITVVNGKAHLKHTEGGDFREATERALRNGLRLGKSVLLEPYFEFALTIPQESLGKAMNDLGLMKAAFKLSPDEENTIIGIAPVKKLKNYNADVAAYTGGRGRLKTKFAGYYKCTDAESVIESIGYDCDSDYRKPSGSIFCSHGAGHAVSFDEVSSYMHLPKRDEEEAEIKENVIYENTSSAKKEEFISIEEIDSILDNLGGSNKRHDPLARKRRYREKTTRNVTYKAKVQVRTGNYLIVDGYNMIHALDELKIHAKDNMDGARLMLLEKLSNYQGFRGNDVTVVFDAYKVKNPCDKREEYHNIHVIFTKENETADAFIEKYTRENCSKLNITVATNDYMIQQLVRGAGGFIYSSNDLLNEIEKCNEEIRNIIN